MVMTEPKITRRMKDIVRFLTRTNGMIVAVEDGESNIVEITIEGMNQIVDNEFIAGELFGSCTNQMLTRLYNSGLIIESESSLNSGKDQQYHGVTTWYILKKKELDK